MRSRQRQARLLIPLSDRPTSSTPPAASTCRRPRRAGRQGKAGNCDGAANAKEAMWRKTLIASIQTEEPQIEAGATLIGVIIISCRGLKMKGRGFDSPRSGRRGSENNWTSLTTAQRAERGRDLWNR